ncbi:epoxide hydrolase [Panacibacter ginsenosidivorans]|uniref:Epoxide hydrolase n=1 Tax=Panacibacter ginsenosidivorans TaxID=1813871 RepID=A0A5B8VDJ5_9BACT|nr:epoxide hydrolase family protein [Panacibacter ginsenosidivorans]QEC69544.1 epoxide hydrolase [Panacibacter ginsenosidivorans]
MTSEFKCQISQVEIDDLKFRIKQTRWTDEIKNSGWEYGADLSYIKKLADYWLNKFDWRMTENEINQYPNYIAEIDGVEIHFLHIKGTGKISIPLIITHGWPGSFLEMIKLIPHLTTDPEISFDLIIPSIIGFGFSQKINTSGCDLWFIADLWAKLITELGYKKALAQGGDFGAGINTALALRHPDKVLGLHLNYIHSSYLPFLSETEKYSAEEIEFQKSSDEWSKTEGAYAHQHRTKPLTLAYGLADSPIGLCAWIVEKFYAWSDCNGNIESVFTKDELLANISLYWFTETIHSSIRLYNEVSKVPLHFLKNDFINVPVGIVKFRKEEPFPPRKFIERGYNVQHWTEISKGGHFAAMEQPELLANDIMKFAKTLNYTR